MIVPILDINISPEVRLTSSDLLGIWFNLTSSDISLRVTGVKNGWRGPEAVAKGGLTLNGGRIFETAVYGMQCDSVVGG